MATYDGSVTSQLQAKYFSLRENKWVTVENPPSCYKSFYYKNGFEHRCTFVSGALHWRLYPEDTSFDGEFRDILAFDLKEKKFRGVPIDTDTSFDYYCLGAIEDKLCLLTRHNCTTTPAELWVMEEHGNYKSWTKRFTDLVSVGYFFDQVCNECDFFPWERGRHIGLTLKDRIVAQLVRLVAQGEEDDGHRICRHGKWFKVIAYTETLFSPNC